MSSQVMLQFDFNGAPLVFPVEEVERGPSPFTGRELRKRKTEVTVAPQDAAQVKEFLATAPMIDAEGFLWSGNLDTESYSNDGPHSLTITWSESEHLEAESVEFEGLIVTPSAGHYEEPRQRGRLYHDLLPSNPYTRRDRKSPVPRSRKALRGPVLAGHSARCL